MKMEAKVEGKAVQRIIIQFLSVSSVSALIWVGWREGATGLSQCGGCGEGYRDGHP